ncbi:MAG: VCBS repeat-containing protein [Alphaproteobacteria bacterium]|nr:VCBS repeat-containing protein [Alphaproteobacteria bacterium]
MFQGFVYDLAPLNGAIGYACGADAQDYNQDGYEDLWLGNYPGSSQDTMFFGSATGLQQAAVSMVPRDDDYTTDISSADLNGDGWMDVISSNHWDPAWVNYNNLDGTNPGDFDQPNSTQMLTSGVQFHNAMEPGDLDGDGRIDLYASNWSNESDAMLVNTGNDANGRVIWDARTMPGHASARETSKVMIQDLNGDGRPELFVNAMDGRPVLYRNVSRPGEVAFVEWTPPGAVGDDELLASFTTGAVDLSGDGKLDLVVAGNAGEHVLEAIPTPRYNAATLGGTLPAITAGPISVYGFGHEGTFTAFQTMDLAAGQHVSVVARSCGDIALSPSRPPPTSPTARRRATRSTWSSRRAAT